MARRVKFHLSLPTPLHPYVLLATAVLLVLRLFDVVALPWWVVFSPMWLAAVALVLALVSLKAAVRILNRRVRGHRLVVK